MNAPAPRSQAPFLSSLPVQLAVVLGVCLLVYWARLGAGGFHSTEAHRAVPAYEMLDHAGSPNDWLVPRMFEQPYLRKPPGMPWAIAASSALLGQTVFAARAVSALASTAMALLSFAFARRWFGARAALPAGLACALMPVLWESGRAAEIEALNNLGTQIAALCLIDLLVFGAGADAVRRRSATGLAAAAGSVWLFLAKGPASAPVVAGVVLAACLVRRSPRPLAGSLWIALIPAGLAIGGLLWAIARAADAEALEPVTQSPAAFLFEPGMLLGVLTLPFAAFVQTLPASFGLLFPFGPDARRETEHPDWTPERLALARALAIAWLVSIGVFMLVGVRNPRYTLPAALLLPPLAGAYLGGLGRWLAGARPAIARVLTLGRPIALAVALLIGAGIYVFTVEASRRATSATPTGERIAAALAPWLRDQAGPVTLVADDAIEARPELLLALERAVADEGLELRIRWEPGFGGELPADLRETTVIALLRVDPESAEAGLPAALPGSIRDLGGLAEAGPWDFHKYRAALYLISASPFAD